MKKVALLTVLVVAVVVAGVPAQAAADEARTVADLIEKAKRYTAGPMSKKIALGALKALGAYGWRARGTLPTLVDLCGRADKEIAEAAAEAIDRIAKASASVKEVDTGEIGKEVAEAKKLAEELRKLKAASTYSIAVLPFKHSLTRASVGDKVLTKALSAASGRLADDLVQGLHVRVPTRAQSGSYATDNPVERGRKLKVDAVVTGELTDGPELVVRCIDVETGHLMWKKALPVPAASVPTLYKSKALEEAFAAIRARLKPVGRSTAPEKATPKKRLPSDVVAVLPANLSTSFSFTELAELSPLSTRVTHGVLKEGKLRLVPPEKAAAFAKAKPVDAGRELGAGAVLVLAASLSGDVRPKNVVITAELVEPETGLLRWRNQWVCERSSKDFSAFVARTADSISTAVNRQLAK
jgi:hypothetical protein